MSEVKLTPPPRRVPIGMKALVAFSDLTVMPYLLIFVVGSLLAFLFSDRSLISSLKNDLVLISNSETIKGEVTNAHGRRPTKVSGYYQVDGVDYICHSYKRRAKVSVGSEVNILYCPENPEVSKIEGMRLYKSSYFIFLFPVLCLGFSVPGLSRSRKIHAGKADLFRHGIILNSTYTGEAIPTSMSVNKRPVYRFLFKTEPWKEHKDGLEAARVTSEEPSVGETTLALVNPNGKQHSDDYGVDIQSYLEKGYLTPNGEWSNSANPIAYGLLLVFALSCVSLIWSILVTFSIV